MSGRNFMSLLQAKWDEGKFICVGLDSDAKEVRKMDFAILSRGSGERIHQKVLSFNKRIVEATRDIVCAYKPNSAFYEALGEGGVWALYATIDYIHEVAPSVPVILDVKRGDIGNTNNGYVEAAYHADAVTLNPYLGREAMMPFLDQADLGNIYLVRTSNPGAGEFQDLPVRVYVPELADYNDVEMPLYQYIARRIAGKWNEKGNCAVVFGATAPAELAEGRKIVGDMPILIPGVGKQGGDLEASVLAGSDSHGQGMIINNARAIIFASHGKDFAEAARAATQKMHDEITAALAA